MHDVADLQVVAAERLEDARALINAGRFAGASYVAGFAVEIALKARICLTLGWTGFPETRRDFDRYQSLKTHDLRVLLRFSGMEAAIKTSKPSDWSVILGWDPMTRYSAAMYTERDASDMIASATSLVAAL